MWFIGVEVVEQETSAPPPKKNPGSAPGMNNYLVQHYIILINESKLGTFLD